MIPLQHLEILDNFEFLVWYKNADGVFLDVNDKFAIATGLNDVHLIIGKTDFDVWPYDLALGYTQDDEFVMQSKVPKKVIEEVYDGERKWFETFKKPVFDNLGNVVGTFGYAIDLSEKINFQKQLEELNEKLSIESSKLKTLINSIPDLVWLKDVNGVYQSCNKRFENFFGASQEEITGKTDYDFVSKQIADSFRDNDNKAISSNEPISSFEEILFANDNHKEYVKTTKTKVLDQNGSIIGVLGIGRDFTAEKKASEKLQFQKKELETIFDTTKDGIAVIDLDMNFIKVNKSFCHITGLDEENIYKISCLDLVAVDKKPEFTSKFNDLLTLGNVDNFENIFMINGIKITVSISLAILPDNERILASIKDISKFRVLEEQAKLASMGEMIGNIAHQWRQPLSIITTISSGIVLHNEFGEIDKDDITSKMNIITKQAQYLSKTIDDFRNFISNNQTKQHFSIKNTLEKTVSILKSAIQNNNINLILNIKDDIVLYGYENELVQSFINIINNSRDAIKENSNQNDDRLIFINTKIIDEGCVITIKDSGGGIPISIMNRIFEPYFTTKHQSIGTGIGLSMTYKIITQRHDAKIEVENENYEYNNKQFRGACFKISFKV